MMWNECVSDMEFVEILMFIDRMIYFFFRYKKFEVEEGVIGLRNFFLFGYIMLNMVFNDLLDF